MAQLGKTLRIFRIVNLKGGLQLPVSTKIQPARPDVFKTSYICSSCFSKQRLLDRFSSWCATKSTHTSRCATQRILTRCNATVAGIQKQVSALATKRPARKKTIKSPDEEKDIVDSVVAYAVAEEIDLNQLRKGLQVQGLYDICDLPVDVQDAVHVKAKYAVDEKQREVFLFRDGSAVFWFMPEVERREVLKFLQKYATEPYPQSLVIHEREEMALTSIKGPTSLVNEILQLNEESDEGHATLEKYAFSNAIAQSVKLGIWEASLNKFVDSIEVVTEDLRDGRKISMSRREVLRKTGELFALRHLINLSSDLLDTPDFYWNRAVYEPLYLSVYQHMDVHRRTRVMNEKLSHCCELMDLLRSHLNDAHHTRLEVMIILLIMVEVVFEIIHYIERYFESESKHESYLTDTASTSSPEGKEKGHQNGYVGILKGK